MTTRVVLSCDGRWHGQECRQAIPVGPVETAADARRIAARDGWSATWEAFAGKDYSVRDFCKACTTRDREGRLWR